MQVDWEITLPVTVTVGAASREEAISAARRAVHEALPDTTEGTGKPRAKSLWRNTAIELLKDGASYTEVAKTLGIERSNVTRALPGYGWTKQQGVEFRELKKAMDEATL